MAHILLEQLDNEYKEKRAQLISQNYNTIVGEIQNFFQINIIHKIDTKIVVQEIIKFDYMTNLKSDGDKHLWIHFTDDNHHLHTLHIINDTLEDRCIFNTTNYLLKDLQLPKEIIDQFSKLCLSEFRRGYDKP